MTFTILWPHGRALNVPATGGDPAPDSVAAALPYRWRKAFIRADGWRRQPGNHGPMYCVLRTRRGSYIVTLYAIPAP